MKGSAILALILTNKEEPFESFDEMKVEGSIPGFSPDHHDRIRQSY